MMRLEGGGSLRLRGEPPSSNPRGESLARIRWDPLKIRIKEKNARLGWPLFRGTGRTAVEELRWPLSTKRGGGER